MSYDLFFKPSTHASEADVLDYFRDRPHYKIDGKQVLYGNEDTGTYFGFEFDNGDTPGFPIALNINYYRPSFFILEAAPEVAAFVDEFQLVVADPQRAMKDGRFNVETMMASWNRGNAAATREIVRSEPNEEHFALPTATLHRAWRWNLQRAQLQASVGESKFVPLIIFASIDGQMATSAVWVDGIPAVLPKVDHLCISRGELAPRKFFRKEADVTFVSWESAAPLLLQHGSQSQDGTIVLNYDTPPAEIVKFIKSRPQEMRSTFRLYSDRVVDSEMVRAE
jgi:hypothetical protein